MLIYMEGIRWYMAGPISANIKCSLCEIDKDASEYSSYSYTRHGKHYNYSMKRCKPCHATNQRAHRAKPEVRERLSLYNKERNYGLSSEGYYALLNKFNYRCGICLSKHNLEVDHCHTTGKVRGILCGICNRGLGLFKDNPEYLTQACNYLKDSNELSYC